MTESLFAACLAYIKRNEGLRLDAYKDTTGHETIGYGHKMHPGDPDHVSLAEAEALCHKDVTHAVGAVERISGYEQFLDNQIIVLVDMCYQMGEHGLLEFVNFLSLLRQKQYAEAADELLQSEYAKQTPKRAKRNAEMIRMD